MQTANNKKKQVYTTFALDEQHFFEGVVSNLGERGEDKVDPDNIVLLFYSEALYEASKSLL